MVAPSPGDTFAPFAYTVGLSREGGSELIMLGIDHRTAGRILNDIAAIAWNRKTDLDGPLEDILDGGFSLDLRPMNLSEFPRYLGRLLWFHENFGSDPLRMTQVVWPDKLGRYPDDGRLTQEERERAARRQPLLTEHRDGPANST